VIAFGDMVDRYALPVIAYRPRYVSLPSDHPMLLGYEPAAYLKDADVVLVLDCDVPWIPSLHKLNPAAKVIQIGTDPLYARYPVRGFPCDLAITGASSQAVPALAAALESRAKVAAARIEARRRRVADAGRKQRELAAARTEAARRGGPIDASWVAHCLNQIKGDNDILVSESQIDLANLTFRKPGTYFATSPAGGLGWGVGAALGVKLGAPGRRVFSVIGDGSYMFGNPTPAHFVSAAYDLPVLTVILNNGMWGSVRKATLGLYPEGAAARMNRAPLTYLEPQPAYHKVVEASGGYGAEVSTPADLPVALERALKAVEVEKRQAVLNVHAMYDDSAALSDARR
jgi:acetolactate synthase-1/2/3 large subunit